MMCGERRFGGEARIAIEVSKAMVMVAISNMDSASRAHAI
jgi:hypothetical protein